MLKYKNNKDGEGIKLFTNGLLYKKRYYINGKPNGYYLKDLRKTNEIIIAYFINGNEMTYSIYKQNKKKMQTDMIIVNKDYNSTEFYEGITRKVRTFINGVEIMKETLKSNSTSVNIYKNNLLYKIYLYLKNCDWISISCYKNHLLTNTRRKYKNKEEVNIYDKNRIVKTLQFIDKELVKCYLHSGLTSYVENYILYYDCMKNEFHFTSGRIVVVEKINKGTCIICRSGKSEIKLSCGHCGHVQCLCRWILQFKQCPYCQTILDK
jgi:hypothetical protein